MIASRMIIRPLLPQWPALDATAQDDVARHAAAFVRRSIALAPAHIRAGVFVVSIILHVLLVVTAPVAEPANRTRQRVLTAFARVSGPAAGVMRLYRSLTVLAFYEHPLVIKAMTAENPAARRAQFRSYRRSLVTFASSR